MKNRLPLELENLELPADKYAKIDKKTDDSYGYVNILYLLSLIISLGSVLALLFLGNR